MASISRIHDKEMPQLTCAEFRLHRNCRG